MRDKRRPHMIRVRAHDEELDAIQRRANAAGLSLSEYLRRRGAGWAIPANASALAEIAQELGPIGTNINQLAKLANQGRLDHLAPEHLRGLKILAASMAKLRDALAS